ncbi:hypothetical protein GCK72_001915 [Caenorhabditis remanei]|uniref:Uncharacterized protein n=1 Tax=Caenorhabditis remanei TaxID=31234 RepID=A0A6A5HV20_CAERE|nr:hypothetical protein GCK72_001915 [Caenorhabditis remanei]KAF1770097.1 hypothetical protein GCK72_001915 [Caenorhabditis remanei]
MAVDPFVDDPPSRPHCSLLPNRLKIRWSNTGLRIGHVLHRSRGIGSRSSFIITSSGVDMKASAPNRETEDVDVDAADVSPP